MHQSVTLYLLSALSSLVSAKPTNCSYHTGPRYIEVVHHAQIVINGCSTSTISSWSKTKAIASSTIKTTSSTPAITQSEERTTSAPYVQNARVQYNLPDLKGAGSGDLPKTKSGSSPKVEEKVAVKAQTTQSKASQPGASSSPAGASAPSDNRIVPAPQADGKLPFNSLVVFGDNLRLASGSKLRG